MMGLKKNLILFANNWLIWLILRWYNTEIKVINGQIYLISNQQLLLQSQVNQVMLPGFMDATLISSTPWTAKPPFSNGKPPLDLKKAWYSHDESWTCHDEACRSRDWYNIDIVIPGAKSHIEKGPTYDILKWIPINITNLSRYMINYHNPWVLHRWYCFLRNQAKLTRLQNNNTGATKNKQELPLMTSFNHATCSNNNF